MRRSKMLNIESWRSKGLNVRLPLQKVLKCVEGGTQLHVALPACVCLPNGFSVKVSGTLFRVAGYTWLKYPVLGPCTDWPRNRLIASNNSSIYVAYNNYRRIFFFIYMLSLSC